ncbi:Hypothetical_protein [Hexamita inflata]|uniref:Hypothetical_protein n=1 Tax=Hexamita inflata TaxID=28002 RepID=A0AA86R640_9EUKA|nr:Hypothetical protein HINF_LOCUS58910 [Hexamita inflata]CAI9976017.1 Hypothetical protein HINF_LOCUS63662 [Hexamita inflata]
MSEPKTPTTPDRKKTNTKVQQQLTAEPLVHAIVKEPHAEAVRIVAENNAQQGGNVPTYTTLPNDLKEVKNKLIEFVNSTIRFNNPLVMADVKEQVITRIKLARGTVKELSMGRFLLKLHYGTQILIQDHILQVFMRRLIEYVMINICQRFNSSIKIQVITIEDLTKQKVDLIQQRPPRLHKELLSLKYKAPRLNKRSPSLKFFTN